MNALRLLIVLYTWVLFARGFATWMPQLPSSLRGVRQVLELLTEPVLRPLRRVVPMVRVGGVGVDFSITVAILIFVVLHRLL